MHITFFTKEKQVCIPTILWSCFNFDPRYHIFIFSSSEPLTIQWSGIGKEFHFYYRVFFWEVCKVENYLSYCTPCLLSTILVQRISHSWTWEHVLESIRVAWLCLLIFPKSYHRQTNLCDNPPSNENFCYLVEILSSTFRHPEWRDCRPHSCKFRRWSIWLTSWPSSYGVELLWW